MRRFLVFLLFSCCLFWDVRSQLPIRPDAFPPAVDTVSHKGLLMADSVDQMSDWTHYPTYDTYVSMMRLFAENFPSICRLDTIGLSVQNRLILAVKISDNVASDEPDEPEFFYSSTMHGDELAGFHFMLHLIDTLLNSYGSASDLTDLVNSTEIFINPLSNPDGTYYGGNHTVASSRRNNANNIDLNRNFPDPFLPPSKAPLQAENIAMIDYVSNHHFLLSANLHGGSEVMNYPWDSFTSWNRPHPEADWWQEVSARFVDTCRLVNPNLFTGVSNSGYIAGGDWYVIHYGRQDYMNYYHNMLEMTMELSMSKKLSSDKLHDYWAAQYQSLINYIKEIHNLPPVVGIDTPVSDNAHPVAFPNPTRDMVNVATKSGLKTFDLSGYPAGIYFLPVEGVVYKVVKL